MVQIIPAILATNEEEYTDKLKKIESAPELAGGWIQIDLMDHKFVQNQSIGADVVARNPTSMKVEAQLMVEYPDNWIDDLIEAKVNRIIFPVEDLSGVEERIKHIKNHEIEVGLSINPETEVSVLEPFASLIDAVLVMSVKPGFGGQDYIPESTKKVAQIQNKGWEVQIGVDGGINSDNVKELVEAGADYVVMGTHLIEGDIEANLEEIWEKLIS
jgi:ribulose-phosphate 3-epimerase